MSEKLLIIGFLISYQLIHCSQHVSIVFLWSALILQRFEPRGQIDTKVAIKSLIDIKTALLTDSVQC